jgi:hypothetical protein
MRAFGAATCLAAGLCLAGSAASCTDQLPDQDLRIVEANPVERLSATLLWEDYQKDADAADRRYRGSAIVITGAPTEVGSGEPGQRFVRFVVADRKGAVRAYLLDEQAESILGSAKGAPRLTLKCFCQGLAGDIVLKSCVTP